MLKYFIRAISSPRENSLLYYRVIILLQTSYLLTGKDSVMLICVLAVKLPLVLSSLMLCAIHMIFMIF